MFALLIDKLSPTVRAILAGVVILCVFGLVGHSVYLGEVDLKVGLGIAFASLVNAGAILQLLVPKAQTNVDLPSLEATKAVAELAKRANRG